MLSLLPQSDAAVDRPDERDYKFWEVFWATEKLPRRVVHNYTKAQNQNAVNEPSTKYACVFYSATHIINEENAIERKNVPELIKEIKAEDISKIAYERKLLTLDSWAFLQSGPKLAKDLWYSIGYTMPETVDEIRSAIARNQLVQFWTRSFDWKKTLTNPDNIVIAGKCYWHSMIFEWYDDDLHGWCFIIRNSLGEFGNFRWRQFLKYSDISLIYPSRYAYVDKPDEQIILEYQKKKRLELAHERGYWNTQRPNDLATRYEASRMAIRMGAFYQENVPESNIWNGQDKNANTTLFEVKKMFENATKRKFSFELWPSNRTITRSDLAALSVRL